MTLTTNYFQRLQPEIVDPNLTNFRASVDPQTWTSRVPEYATLAEYHDIRDEHAGNGQSVKLYVD